jgi:hypothetical protein
VVRAYLEDRVLILYNRSEQPKGINLDVDPEFSDGPLIDPLGSLSKQEVQKGKLTLLLPALSSSILISQ